jgi:phosphohistidine phosphatase
MKRKQPIEIWLLRHAKAERGGPGIPDRERALTPAARRKMRSTARAIAQQKPRFDGILTSPLVRARQTAEPVARAIHAGKAPIQTEALSPWADPKEILEEIERRKLTRSLLVGHMPHLGKLLGYLLTGRQGTAVEIKKSSLARVEFDGASPDPPGTLTLLLTAKALSRKVRS